MLQKHSYFTGVCDGADYDEGNAPSRCRAEITVIYVPAEREGAAGEYARREIRAQGWQVAPTVARAPRTIMPRIYCPNHKVKSGGRAV